MQLVEKMLPWAPLVARIIFAGFFFMSVWGKITSYSGTLAYVTSAGVPMPDIALPLGIALELFGALSLLFGYRVLWGALSLIVFTALASYFFHFNFEEQIQQVLFFKNMAIIAGLLYVAHFGAGKLSIEN
jgi:putative oxidoreductase